MNLSAVPRRLISWIQPGAHRAQLLADAQLLGLEAGELLLLLRASGCIAELLSPPWTAAPRACSSVARSCCLQFLFLGPEAVIGRAPQRLDALEGPLKVARPRTLIRSSLPARLSSAFCTRSPLLAKAWATCAGREVLRVHPQVVREHVGVGEDHEVQRLGRVLERVARAAASRPAAGRRGRRCGRCR